MTVGMFGRILEALSLPAFVIDEKHVVMAWNKPCEMMTGVRAEDVVGTDGHWRGFYDNKRPCLADLVLDDRMDAASDFYDTHSKTEFSAGGHTAEGWFTLSGKRRFLVFEANVIFDGDRAVGALEVLHDLTNHKNAEEQLKLSASVFENTSEGIMITDGGNRILSVNKALLDQTGYSEEEMLGQTPNMLASARHPRSFYRKMWATLAEIDHWQGELWNKKRTGEEYLVRAYISAVRTEGVLTNYIGLLTDITESSKVMDKMEHMAHHDFLTGLPNRSLLEDRMRQALRRARRNKTRFAVMFMDLDKFKMVNDTLGHDAGDMLLKEVSRRIQGCVRATDTVSRQGGDEFVVLMEDFHDDSDVVNVARKILAAVSAPCELKGSAVEVTTSLGISLHPADGVDEQALLKHADLAMYEAKGSGRNNFQFFTAGMNTKAFAAMILESGLRKAIPGGLVLHYQPQLNLAGKKLHGAEALVRWNHPDLGLLGPAKFIPVAEESGLIVQLGEWVLNEACRVMKETGLRMSVNLSPRQMSQPDLVEKVAAAVKGCDAKMLTLEITESSFINDMEKTKEMLVVLKSLGVSLALDDFGTGYSSLSCLHQLPFDHLKIDQSFVREPKNAPLVLAILEMAEKLNLMTVAEGVETDEQMRFLEENGCDVVQGYHFARPLTREDLELFAAAFCSDGKNAG